MRFGLLGTGFWAAQTQGAALAAHASAELVGVWGRDPAKAAAVAGPLGAAPYDDVDALIADVDAVAIALPPDVQAGLAARAAQAGRHLLLDKPLALTAAGADAVVDAVDAAGVASMVFFTNRFRPEIEDVPDHGRRDRRLVRRPGRDARVDLPAGQPVRRLAVAPGVRRAVGHRPARAVDPAAVARRRRRGHGGRRAAGHASTSSPGTPAARPANCP